MHSLYQTAISVISAIWLLAAIYYFIQQGGTQEGLVCLSIAVMYYSVIDYTK